MSASPHALNWFEIPVTNFARAKTFYEAVLGQTIEPMVMGPSTMGFYLPTPKLLAAPSCIATTARHQSRAPSSI